MFPFLFLKKVCNKAKRRWCSPCSYEIHIESKLWKRRVKCVNRIIPSYSLCKCRVNYTPIARERSRLHSSHIKIKLDFIAEIQKRCIWCIRRISLGNSDTLGYIWIHRRYSNFLRNEGIADTQDGKCINFQVYRRNKNPPELSRRAFDKSGGYLFLCLREKIFSSQVKKVCTYQVKRNPKPYGTYVHMFLSSDKNISFGKAIKVKSIIPMTASIDCVATHRHFCRLPFSWKVG